ncbi:MAG: 30S ribosomal protein S6--L-glutamate ligase [Bacteroidetes bacterium]|nr:30S ribosomal protein S6--L-glutamate ligase [Bacteroidota bacterium]GDX47677.1 putative alpha-L-glutamate ligase [Bacteroidota bacterium]
MRIAVLSRNPKLYSTRRLIDAGAKRGHYMEVIDHTKCYVLIEKGKPGIRYQGKAIEHFDAVIPRIGASVTAYGTAIVRQFEMMKIFSATESQGIVRSRDKLRSLQLLSREGIGIPKTAFADHVREVDDLIEQVGGAPLVIKLLEGTQGIGVILADTHKSAKSIIEAFYNQEINILVQEFIAEANSSDVRAFVVDGRVVGAMIRTGKAGDFRSNLHRGGTARVIHLTQEEEDAAIQSAKALGLRIAGVDMLQSARGPLIIEVNSSPGLKGIETATGLDIAGEIISYIERSAGTSTSRDTIGV